MNKILFKKDARDKILKGVNIVADAVGSTLGPRGCNVAMSNGYQPLVIHDGVTVARKIELKDEFENIGAQLVKEASQKTNDKAGDGTTTSAILAQALVNESLKLIDSGANPQTLKKQIEEALSHSLVELKNLSKKIKTNDEILSVASISASDDSIGKLVAEAILKVSKDGVVTVEDGDSFETKVVYKQGMELERGYLSNYFITDPDRAECVMKDPYVLITDKKIMHNHELVPFLEMFLKTKNKDLVIVGEVGDEALATLVVNKMRGTFNVLAVMPAGFGHTRLDQLQDLAILGGGNVISQDSGRELGSVKMEELARFDKVISSIDKTIFLGGKGKKEDIENKLNQLRSQISLPSPDFEKELRKQRLAKLTGGVAVIQVGAYTDTELREKKERVIDAVNATKSAIEDGIVAGGEITLLELSNRLVEKDLGSKILSEALRIPFKRLLENSGLDYTQMMIKLSGKKYPYGVDVMREDVVDLIKEGVIDPVKVTKSALENAISVATMIMTTNTVIVDINQK